MRLRSVYPSILSLMLVSDACVALGTHQLHVPKAPLLSDTLSALSRKSYQNRLKRREENPKNTTNIAKSWNGATLFSL